MNRTCITTGRETASRIWLPLIGSAAGHAGLLGALLLLGAATGPRGGEVIQVLLVKGVTSARPVDGVPAPSSVGGAAGSAEAPTGGKNAPQDLPSSAPSPPPVAPPAEVQPVPRPAAPASPAQPPAVRPLARGEEEGSPVRDGTAGAAGTEEEDAGEEGVGAAPSPAREGEPRGPGSGDAMASASGVGAFAAGDGPAGEAEPGHLVVLRARIQERIVYPEEAVRRGQQGDVLLRIRVGTGGVPSEIRIARSSGVRLLDEAASRGVVRAAPLPSDPGWVEVPIRFRLR